MKTGEFIRQRRLYLGISQQEVAQACGVSRSAVCKWQSGEISSAKRDKIEKLARVLGIDPMDITRVEIGIDIDTNTPDPQATANPMTLTEEEATIVREWRKLRPDQQLIIARMIEAFQTERIANEK